MGASGIRGKVNRAHGALLRTMQASSDDAIDNAAFTAFA